MKTTVDFRIDRETANLQARWLEELEIFAKRLSLTLDNPKIAKIQSQARTSRKRGWVFIGEFKEGSWVSLYLDFDKKDNPKSLVKSTASPKYLTRPLNIREAMPDPVGRFSPLIDVLRPGDKAEILMVEQWHSSNYWWAKIEYEGQ